MDILAPDLPDFDPATTDAFLSTRRPGMGEALGAAVQEGFQGTVAGVVATRGRFTAAERADPAPLSREEWDRQFAREGLTWDERMTRGRAAAMAEEWDERNYRRRVQAARDPGALETVAGFGAQLAGSILTPENFVPFAGPAARGLRALGAVRAADTLMAPGVGAAALRGAVDATLGTAAAMPVVLPFNEQFGDEVTFGRVLGELAIGALIGTGFGAAGGLLARGADTRLAPDTMAAVRTVDAMARDLAAGRPMEAPAAAVRAIEEAAERSAPPSLQGVALRDLPTTEAGLPLSRAAFEQWQAGRVPPSGLRRDLLTSAAPVEFDAAGRPVLAAPPPRFTPDLAAPVEPSPPTRAEQVRAPVLDEDGQPIVALSRDEARALVARLARQGERDVEFIRLDGEPGAYAVAAVPDATVYRTPDGAPRVYPSASRAKTAARQIEGAGWVPVEVDGGFVLMRASGAMGTRLQANRRLVEIGGDVLAAPRADGPARTALRLEDAIRADEYGWYLEALDAREQVQRLTTSATPLNPPAGKSAETGGNLRENAANPRGENQSLAPDPETEAALRQIEAMRADGRLTDADEAILRAGNDEADELDATARGLTEAGECLLRNLA